MSFFQLQGILQWILSVRSLQVASLRPSPQSPCSGTHFPYCVSAAEHSEAGLDFSCFPPAEQRATAGVRPPQPANNTQHDTPEGVLSTDDDTLRFPPDMFKKKTHKLTNLKKDNFSLMWFHKTVKILHYYSSTQYLLLHYYSSTQWSVLHSSNSTQD